MTQEDCWSDESGETDIMPVTSIKMKDSVEPAYVCGEKQIQEPLSTKLKTALVIAKWLIEEKLFSHPSSYSCSHERYPSSSSFQQRK
ncbi:hypothetical protein AVEN_115072-1 [Araneus ventricosus]|uniref:Uncharacterized protein n=1 Tax=Araneus ventricosus TaxID=182803 RepID=A0A4Y1ZX35_ARAVE|nr:hypothetical protein AVEN_115072-1 [Araneus ventricosus]